MSKNKFKAEDFTLKSEDKKDFKKSTIQRDNISDEFTVAAVEENQRYLDKMYKEMDGQIKVSKAYIDNVSRNHPKILELSGEELAAAVMLVENSEVLKQAKEKMKEITLQQKEYKDLLKIIYKKFGFVESAVLDEPST